MACRIGITTDLIERERFWRSKYPRTFHNWQVVETHYTKSIAQSRETFLANVWGCEASPGGDGPENENAAWFVYYFQHDNA